jgi:hypothetical protein
MHFLYIFLYVMAGAVIGSAVTFMVMVRRTKGTIHIVDDHLEAPYMFIELKCGINDISDKSIIELYVKKKDMVPHW